MKFLSCDSGNYHIYFSINVYRIRCILSHHPEHFQLANIVDNALLHLYGVVSQTQRFVPTIKRNEILVRYLKPKLKSLRFKSIKAELKILIAIGRKRNGNLEAKLLELNRLANKYYQDMTDAHLLFKLMEILEDEYGFDSKLFDPNSIAIPDVIYVLPEHIENCFSDEGMQVAPVSLFIESERAMNLLSIIGESQLFSAEMQEWNETTHQAHILLHPISH
ncbi:DUF2913 family protein [Photobacterium damselae]|uniref:DUF2913 family protein n=1 Tax=Photobacterium damselae TaxID=38293 RepID=UPI001F0A4B3F|nr:DUF2913 family protein [Photobacterium damselae]